MSSSANSGAEQSPLVDDDPEGKGGVEQAPTSATGTEEEDFQDELGKEEEDAFIEENEEELEKAVTEDIYSLLYTAPVIGPTFIFAFIIFLLQAGLLLLIFLDLVDTSSTPNDTNGRNNRIDLPAGAEMEVTISQFVGILLTVMVTAFHGDSVKGIMQLMEGYSASIMQDSPHAFRWKWLVTGLLQATEGFLLLVVSFVLIMQSERVIDLTLNLTGLHFIQELDDMGFSLAAAGLISRRTQEDCHHVADLNRTPTPKDKKERLKITKRIFITLIAIGLLIPYFMVVGWQFYGRYMCKDVFVQFGDVFLPDITYYTGHFHIQGNAFRDRIGGRPYYIDETGSVRLAYCRAERAWSFSYLVNDDPCDFLILSAETDNFDVIEIATDDWFAQTDAGKIPLDWLAIVCSDCNDERCQGTCRDDTCECDGERLGFNCEYEMPTCKSYSLDYRTKGNLANVPGARIFLETEFTSLTDFGFIPEDDPQYEMYDRLWYIPNPGRRNPEAIDVNSFIVFIGRRWVMFSLRDDETSPYVLLEFYQKVRSLYAVSAEASNHIEQVFEIFKTDAFAPYIPRFFSTPVDWGTESFGVEPSDVLWVLANKDDSMTLSDYRPDDDSPIGARLMCSECNGEQSCYNGGLCSEDGKCLCDPFFGGGRCEYARSCVIDDDCYNGGSCDQQTNACICPDNQFGSLCQYPNDIQDMYFCSREENACVNGVCNGFEERCDCFEGYEGVRCETVAT